MRRRGRQTPKGTTRSAWESVLRLGAAVAVFLGALAFGNGGSSYAAPALHCRPTPVGVLKVAPAATPLEWYDAANPPPALTDQITEIASHLYPGRSGTMVAYVKNTGTVCGIPSISIRDLVDSGVLSSNINVTVTYTSSLTPGTDYAVATGTLRQLAASGLTYSAPVKLGVYSSCCRDVGTWKIRIEVPASVGNEIQGQRCACSVVFGLTGCAK